MPREISDGSPGGMTSEIGGDTSLDAPEPGVSPFNEPGEAPEAGYIPDPLEQQEPDLAPQTDEGKETDKPSEGMEDKDKPDEGGEGGDKKPMESSGIPEKSKEGDGESEGDKPDDPGKNSYESFKTAISDAAEAGLGSLGVGSGGLEVPWGPTLKDSEGQYERLKDAVETSKGAGGLTIPAEIP